MAETHTIILSRTDSIGDVVLTLPMAGIIKEKYPHARIIFIGRTYTLPIIKRCAHIDEVINFDELKDLAPTEVATALKKQDASTIVHVFPNRLLAKAAKIAGIATRIGTSRRFFHLLTCNKKVNLKRRSSSLHEAQLNAKLLEPLGITTAYTKEQLIAYYGLGYEKQHEDKFPFLEKNKIKIILHPKSKGSAREWGEANFAALIRLLPSEKFQLFFSGTKEEGALFRETLIKPFPQVMDVTGRFSLTDFIDFISCCDGLVACSTGPLHIAAALSKNAIGIYSPMRPLFPQRWAPLGKKAIALVTAKNCEACRKKQSCACIQEIEPARVAAILKQLN